MGNQLAAVLEPVRTDNTMQLLGLQPRRQLCEPVNQFMWQTATLPHRRVTFRVCFFFDGRRTIEMGTKPLPIARLEASRENSLQEPVDTCYEPHFSCATHRWLSRFSPSPPSRRSRNRACCESRSRWRTRRKRRRPSDVTRCSSATTRPAQSRGGFSPLPTAPLVLMLRPGSYIVESDRAGLVRWPRVLLDASGRDRRRPRPSTSISL